MVRLQQENYPLALEAYRRNELFFPLIATVLLGTQDGSVYADSAETPVQFYVEHAFGFAQIFGEAKAAFERDLELYLLVDCGFRVSKVRLYGTYAPDFLKTEHEKVLLSVRQRFKLRVPGVRADEVLMALPHRGDVATVGIGPDNIRLIEEKFGVVDRFWRNADDFILHSNAVIIQYKGVPAAICYSAATADQCAEIDVLTLPEFRQLGLAKLAVAEFIATCEKYDIDPIWDCFTNNTPSMMLAESIGYLPFARPYSFYTINR